MHSARKPWWQQATALVTVSTGGVISGFTFVPGAAAAMTSPSSVPLHLLALEKAAKPADTGDDRLRPAIVNVAGYYLRLAQTRSPAQMEALIWGKDSLDGADHGPSCAAFASLTLELAAQAVGQQSWVSGGTTYPWPLHEWADVRVNPNPASLGVTSMVQDAQAHQRWYPVGDGYEPQPGDWVVFDGHVEVVTSYASGVLDTIGADSLPNLSVNAHAFNDPLAAQGVEGFVDNGHLGDNGAASTAAPAAAVAPGGGAPARGTGTSGGTSGSRGPRPPSQPELAAIPGVMSPAGGAAAAGGASTSARSATAHSATGIATGQAQADIPGAAMAAGLGVAAPPASAAATAKPATSSRTPAPYRQHSAPATAPPGTKTQQAFINQIAPGAMAAQQRFGVPASVTIAQAIDESGWGTSQLAAGDYNLFGIKGGGPAGSVTLPTQEFENGQWLTVYAQFRAYHNLSESIADHAELLATSGYYTRAMADRGVPDAFANDLTGVYATDPEYGSNLIAIMRLYNLYRFDSPAATQSPAAHPPATHPSGSPAPGSQASVPGILAALAPSIAGTPSPSAGQTPAAQPQGSPPAGSRASVPGMFSALAPGRAATPAPSAAHGHAAQPTPGHTSGSQPPGSQASIPGLFSALAPTHAGPAAPGPAHTHTAQPADAQPAASEPSGSQPPGSQAWIPGMVSGLAPAGATHNQAAQPSASRGQGSQAPGPAVAATPRATRVPSAPAAPSATRAASSGTASVSSAGHGHTRAQASPTAAPGGLAPSARGAAAVPGADVGAPTATAPRGNRAHAANYADAGPGAAAVPGGGAPVQGLAAAGMSVAGLGAASRGRRSEERPAAGPTARAARGAARVPGVAAPRQIRYDTPLPAVVATAFFAKAKAPLARAEQLHRDVADQAGIRWQLLAACDWMQCHADRMRSPVQGERLGSLNPDGTVYRTKSQALAQCASDLIQLADAVYGLDLTAPCALPVRVLADVFAAFRWGGLLRRHGVSAMEFPYSVAGLTEQHLKMHWPDITEPDAPDKPGSKFRGPFGAVPVLLSLNYPALV